MCPHSRCKKTGKIIFASSAAAKAELAKARRRRAAGVFGVARGNSQQLLEGRVEQRIHPCFRGGAACGGWHLTAEDEPPPPPPRRKR